MEDNSRDQHVLPLGIIGMPLVRLDDGEVDQLAYLPGNDCSPNQLLGGPNPNKADGDVHHWLLHKVTIHNHTPASRLILGGQATRQNVGHRVHTLVCPYMQQNNFVVLKNQLILHHFYSMGSLSSVQI